MTLSLKTIRSVVDKARGPSNELLAITNGLAELPIQIGMRGQFTRPVERLTALEPLTLAIVVQVEDKDDLVAMIRGLS